jgi:hypothetical protein
MNVPWCDSPFLEQRMHDEALPAELAAMVRKYARDGYVIVDPALPEALMDAAVRDMDGRYREGGGGTYASKSRVQDAWQFSPAVRQIASNPRVLDLLYLLYRRPAIPFQTLNFPRGTEQRTHSDTIHFHSVPHGFMCGVWIAFEDIDLTNGPLHYYPGSHRLPYYDMHDLGITATHQGEPYERYGDTYEAFVESLMRVHRLPRHELQVRKGQALVWAANLFHGGSPIIDAARSRHSQVTHYYFTDCLYTTPLLSDFQAGQAFIRSVTNIKNGQQVPQYYNGQRVGQSERWPLELPRTSSDPRLSHKPLPLATTARHRIVAWPRWDEAGDVRRLLAEFGPALADRDDVCLCLRFDRVVDRPYEEAMELLDRAFKEVLGERSMNVLLVDDDLSQTEWPRLAATATGALAAGGPRPSAQRDFVIALGKEVFASGGELAEHLGPPPAPIHLVADLVRVDDARSALGQ